MYSKTKTFRISEKQDQTLKKMKANNVSVGNFIRSAIREKLEREHINLIKPDDNLSSILKDLRKANNIC